MSSAHAKTYAQILSVNRYAVLLTYVNDDICQVDNNIATIVNHFPSLPSPREVRDKVIKSQLQKESDLHKILGASSIGYEEDLDDFVQVKS